MNVLQYLSGPFSGLIVPPVDQGRNANTTAFKCTEANQNESSTKMFAWVQHRISGYTQGVSIKALSKL